LPPEENKKKEKESSRTKIRRKQKNKILNQRLGESKKERKFPIKDRKKRKEIYRKVFGPDNILTIQNCHK